MESAEFEPAQLVPDHYEDRKLSPRPTPELSKQTSNKKLDNGDYLSPMDLEEGSQISISDKRRRSGGSVSVGKNSSVDELRSQHDSDRANLRKMISDKRRQTPQNTEPEVVVLVNNDYDFDYIETHKQRYSAASANPPSQQVTPQPSITPRREDIGKRKDDALVLESINSSASQEKLSETKRMNTSVAFDSCLGLWSKIGIVQQPNAKIVPASPISRRQMAFELEEEAVNAAIEEPSAVLPSQSESVAEGAVDEEQGEFDDEGFPDGDDVYLGQSFVTEMNNEEVLSKLVDPQAALEYSMMLQQMQEILQLPSHPNLGAKALEKIEEGDNEEEIEEGFEEEEFKFEISDSEDEADQEKLHDEDFEVIGDDEIVDQRNDESLEEIEPLQAEGKCNYCIQYL